MGGKTASASSGKTKLPGVFFVPSEPALEMTNELTLEVWIALKQNSRGGSIIDKTGSVVVSGLSGGGFALEMLSPTILQFRTAKKENCIVHFQPPIARWICITAVYSAEKRLFQLFLNGKKKAAVTTGEFPGLVRNFSPLAIGTGNKGKFDGEIARIALFSRSLNAKEVAARFENSLPCKGEIAEWKIVDGKSRKKTTETLFGHTALMENIPVPQLKGLAPKPAEPLTLWYRRPAEYWGEALPLGNGRLGAMVFGRIDREHITLNESTFWSGSPHDYANLGALQSLQQVRSLIFKHQYAEADELLSQAMQGNPSTQCSFQPIGDLIFDLPPVDAIDKEITDYRRQLDLEQGLTSVHYSQGGVSYRRQEFVSAVDQVGVIRWTAKPPGSISFALWFNGSQQTTVDVENNEMLVIQGQVATMRPKIPHKLQFVSRIKVMPTGGEMKAHGRRIEIRNANSVMILWDIATNYRNYHNIMADPDAITHDRISRASGKSFEQLFAAHLAEQKRLFHRISFQLGDQEMTANKPTDTRLKAIAGSVEERTDSALAALYFQFGRYTLLSSSRPGGQPTTISGIWNENPFPESDSKYLLFGPTLMAYWPVEAANLSECLQPVTRLCRELSETGMRTAALMFGAGGWMCFAGTDLWRGSAPSDGAAFYTPVCGAALASLLWKHYLYTGDKQHLVESYPVLKNASQFFLDSLQPLPGRQEKVTCPTVSLGSRHPPGAFSVAGSTFDHSVLRQIFEFTADAAQILNTDEEFREQILTTRRRLPPLRIGRSGRIQTWPQDWPASNWETLQSLYGLFPSTEISFRKSPRLIVAARKSLESIEASGPPWAEAWRACLWARLRDGNRAWKSLKRLLHPSQSSPNFFGAAPGFHLSAVWGATSAILEMLLQHHENGEIELLPALPDAWPNGSLCGIRAYDGFEIDLHWEKGKLTHVMIRSSLGRECKICYKDKHIVFPTEKDHQYKLDGRLRARVD